MASSKWIPVAAVAQDDPEFNLNWKYSGSPAGYKDVITGKFSETLPANGEVLELLNPGVTEETLGLYRVPLYKGSDGYYTDKGKVTQITDQMIPGLLSGAKTRQDQNTEAGKRLSKQMLMAALAVTGAGVYGSLASGAGAGVDSGLAMELSPGVTQAVTGPGSNALAGTAGLDAVSQAAAPAAGSGVGPGTTASLGAAAKAASGAGAGLTASGIIKGIGDVASLAGAVTAINAITGDPLGLNEASDAAKQSQEKANNQYNEAMAKLSEIQARIAGTPGSTPSAADQAAAAAATKSAEEAQARIAENQSLMTEISQNQWDYYKTNYQPLEASLIKQASEAGSPEEFARARGAANADVTGSFDRAKKASESKLQSYGINPGSPAYQAALVSGNLAEGASMAGALTTADRNTRDTAYTKGLEVAKLAQSGAQIPGNIATTAGNAGNLALNAGNLALNTTRADDLRKAAAADLALNTTQVNDRRNETQANLALNQAKLALQSSQQADQRGQVANKQSNDDIQNLGYGLNTVSNIAQKWFGNPTSSTAMTPGQVVDNYGYGYKKGGRVMEGKAKHVFGPHMKSYASGGSVDRYGLEMMGEGGMTRDASALNHPINGMGTETSDSIPAVVDGQEPAALSTNEFVMNAEVSKMSGGEILEAINRAGLEKRQQGPMPPNQMQGAGPRSFARGGRVHRMACAGL